MKIVNIGVVSIVPIFNFILIMKDKFDSLNFGLVIAGIFNIVLMFVMLNVAYSYLKKRECIYRKRDIWFVIFAVFLFFLFISTIFSYLGSMLIILKFTNINIGPEFFGVPFANMILVGTWFALTSIFNYYMLDRIIPESR